MMKNLKLAYAYTFFSLIVPIIIVLLIITSRMWLLTAPIWMTVSYFVISFILEKLIRDNLKLRK
ncbi:MAG: hypothetical protein K0S47_3963, partial [Herbinix sp.]|nr:hypothetical protein [Herbinix sp.]